MTLSRRAGFVLLLLLSGVSGLGHEVVWLRLVAGIVGVSVLANAIVLATFMAGLGAGALLCGRWIARRPRDVALRVYTGLELFVGAWALVVPLLARGANSLFLSLAGAPGSPGRGVAALVCAALVMLPATLAMGATVPALTGALAADERPHNATGPWLGLLYGANTIGAVLGTLLGGWVLIPALGLWRGGALLAALNWLIAGGAWLLRRGAPRAAGGSREELLDDAPRDMSNKSSSRATRAIALTLVAVSGLVGLALELLWMRGLAAYARDTVATQVMTLAAALLGLGLGGLLGGALTRVGANATAARATSLARLVLLQAIAAGAALLGPVFARALAGGGGAPLALHSATGLQIVAVAVLPGALASGATVPIAASILSSIGGDAPARAAGRALAANTAGSVLGALTTGLWWIPRFGTRGATLIIAALAGLSALLAAAHAIGLFFGASKTTSARSSTPTIRARLAFVVPLSLAMAIVTIVFAARARLPAAPHMPARASGGDALVLAREDAVGLVEVLERGGHQRLVTDRRHAWGSDDPLMLRSMRRQGYLPLLLHPRPARVLEVGLATGVQFAPYLRHPAFERGVIVEISPAIAEAAQRFAPAADHVLDDPRVELIIGDGRDALRGADEGVYDVVVLGLFTAYRPGVSDLYSEELYRAGLRALAPGGLLIQWLPLDQLSDAALRSVIRSLLAAAPSVHAFEKEHYLALVASAAPLVIDGGAALRLVETPAIRDDLERHGLLDPYGMLGSHVADAAALRAFAGEGSRNTDDRPFVEFHPPAAQPVGSYTQASRSLEALLAYHVPASARAVGLDAAGVDRLARASRSRAEFLRGAIAQVRGDRVEAAKRFSAAAALNPDDRLAAITAQRARLRRSGPPMPRGGHRARRP